MALTFKKQATVGKEREIHLPPHFHPTATTTTTAAIDQEQREEKEKKCDTLKIPMATVYLTSMFCSLWDATVQHLGQVVSRHKL